MKYISSSEAAKKLNISKRSVNRYAKQGKIPGAILIGNSWAIPDEDDDYNQKRKEAFKMPFYFLNEYFFRLEWLSETELELYQAQKAYFEADFVNAKALLNNFLEKTDNIYYQISCHYYLCCIAIFNSNYNEFDYHKSRIETILEQDFPHRKDFDLVKNDLETITKGYSYQKNNIDIDYDYHPSSMVMLSFIAMYQDLLKSALTGGFNVKIGEMVCKALSPNRYPVISRYFHYALALYYLVKGDKAMVTKHIKAIIDIAVKTKLYVITIEDGKILKPFFDEQIALLPNDIASRIKEVRKQYEKGFWFIIANYTGTKPLLEYSEREIELIALAFSNKSNKEVAKLLKISEHTVSTNYSILYEKTNTKNKAELKEYIFSKMEEY